MSEQRVDRMTHCLLCHMRVKLQPREVNETVQVFKCQNRDCGAEFGTHLEEGMIQDRTGHLVREVE